MISTKLSKADCVVSRQKDVNQFVMSTRSSVTHLEGGLTILVFFVLYFVREGAVLQAVSCLVYCFLGDEMSSDQKIFHLSLAVEANGFLDDSLPWKMGHSIGIIFSPVKLNIDCCHFGVSLGAGFSYWNDWATDNI